MMNVQGQELECVHQKQVMCTFELRNKPYRSILICVGVLDLIVLLVCQAVQSHSSELIPGQCFSRL